MRILFLFLIFTWASAAYGALTSAKGVWIWGGNSIPSESLNRDTLYIHQGWISHQGEKNKFQHQGMFPFPSGAKEIFLVFRLSTLDSDGITLRTALEWARRWERLGNPVAGIQLDFDSRTAHLAEYTTFLMYFLLRPL